MDISNTVIREISAQEAPIHLLLLADPSLSKLEAYLPQSRVWSVSHLNRFIAVAAVSIAGAEAEVMAIAVLPEMQKKGVGSHLLSYLITTLQLENIRRLTVGTGSFGYQLKFYQSHGFRVDSIRKDFFTHNYPEPIYEDGILLQDMLLLALEFPMQSR